MCCLQSAIGSFWIGRTLNSVHLEDVCLEFTVSTPWHLGKCRHTPVQTSLWNVLWMVGPSAFSSFLQHHYNAALMCVGFALAIPVPVTFESQDNEWNFCFSESISSQLSRTCTEPVWVKHFAGCWLQNGTNVTTSHANRNYTKNVSVCSLSRLSGGDLGRVLLREHLILLSVL